MKKLNDKLSEVLDIEPIEFDVVEPVVETAPVPVEVLSTNGIIDEDTEFARNNIRGLIGKANTALDTLLNVATASEHPRAFEVASGLIKNLSDLNKDLLDLQKKRRDLMPRETSNSGGNVKVDKAVFIGNTTELIKMLKANK